ncbi:MAG: hypothetical protein WBD22_06290 [Pyrinomonadaceae bacterium]
MSISKNFNFAVICLLGTAVLTASHFNVSGQKRVKEDVLVPVIAFVSTRDQEGPGETTADLYLATEIYLMDMDGRNPRRLTNNKVSDLYPNLSPDGRRIVFESGRLRSKGDPDNLSDLFIMNADGTTQRHLVRGSSATWSPDGKHIAYHASASGRGTMNRTNPGSATSDSDIFVLNVDEFLKGKAKPRNLTNNSDTVDEDADWSPDGKTIAFTRYGVKESHANTTSTEMFLIDALGKEKPRRLTNNLEEERGPAWSSDGKQIAFMSKAVGSHFQPCVMNVDGTGFRALTTKPGRSVQWSPDGKRIIFHRDVKYGETEDEQIFSVNLSGLDEKQLTSGSSLSGWANPGMVRRKLK